jgi:hypothetical protein
MNKLKMTQSLNKLKFQTVKNSPQILMYLGAVGAIGATIMACRATLKVSEVIDKSQESIKTIRETEANESIEDYTKEDARKDLAIVYVSRGLDLAKLYAPAVIVGGLSIAAMIKSHSILNRRNAALAAAFTTASESFNKYRKAVVDRYGERVDHELRHGIKAEKVSVTDENGKTKKETIDVVEEPETLAGYSDYSRFYDDGCTGWVKDPEYNLMFLKSQQQYANDKLVAQGYLFLNDVYDMLGIPRSKAGQVVGWVYNPDNPVGDNYVDFGIYDVNKPNARDFVNGYERTILLDFNVDGNIWDLM